MIDWSILKNHTISLKQIFVYLFDGGGEKMNRHIQRIIKDHILIGDIILRLPPTLVPMNNMPNIIKWCERKVFREPPENWLVYSDDFIEWLGKNKEKLFKK